MEEKSPDAEEHSSSGTSNSMSSAQLVASRVNWSFAPDAFTESDSALSWTHAAEARLNFQFSLPALSGEPCSFKFTFSPIVASLTINSLIFRDKRGKHLACWNPTTKVARKSPISAVAGASANGEFRNFDLNECCYQLELPDVFAKKVAKGGTLHVECHFAPGEIVTDSINSQGGAHKVFAGNLNDNTPKGLVMRRIVELENEVQSLSFTVKKFYDSNTGRSTRPLREIAAQWRRSWIAKSLLVRQKSIFLRAPARSVKLPPALAVDVIVPVYSGLKETLDCLNSVLGSSPTVNYGLVVINDASPDAELVENLELLARKHPKITLLHNSKNLGFTATVVHGMALHPDRDVVLLNSDTVVSADWLDRLAKQAYCQKRIGSVTPFSNNASICGYPIFLGEEELPRNTNQREVDEIASSKNAGMNVEIPTGVGSCIYITRKCLNDVGTFDAETFPGYGEENDFCLRASLKNWKH